MRCSFCRRSHLDVAKLVAGPLRIFARRVYICDRCAADTIQIMDERSGEGQPRSETPALFRRIVKWLGRRRHHDAVCRSV